MIDVTNKIVIYCDQPFSGKYLRPLGFYLPKDSFCIVSPWRQKVSDINKCRGFVSASDVAIDTHVACRWLVDSLNGIGIPTFSVQHYHPLWFSDSEISLPASKYWLVWDSLTYLMAQNGEYSGSTSVVGDTSIHKWGFDQVVFAPTLQKWSGQRVIEPVEVWSGPEKVYYNWHPTDALNAAEFVVEMNKAWAKKGCKTSKGSVIGKFAKSSRSYENEWWRGCGPNTLVITDSPTVAYRAASFGLSVSLFKEVNGSLQVLPLYSNEVTAAVSDRIINADGNAASRAARYISDVCKIG